jgi:hypothetical protein
LAAARAARGFDNRALGKHRRGCADGGICCIDINSTQT